jgi:hypothetical protein
LFFFRLLLRTKFLFDVLKIINIVMNVNYNYFVILLMCFVRNVLTIMLWSFNDNAMDESYKCMQNIKLYVATRINYGSNLKFWLKWWKTSHEIILFALPKMTIL